MSDQAFECLPHYTGSALQTQCQACAPGFQRFLGGSACVKCSVGNAQSNGEATACQPCQPGTYSNFNGSVMCFDCALGSYAASANAAGANAADRTRRVSLFDQPGVIRCLQF